MTFNQSNLESKIATITRFMSMVDDGATMSLRIDDTDMSDDIYSTRIIIERGVMTIRNDYGDEVEVEYDDWMVDESVGLLVITREMGIGISERVYIDLAEVDGASINRTRGDNPSNPLMIRRSRLRLAPPSEHMINIPCKYVFDKEPKLNITTNPIPPPISINPPAPSSTLEP